MVNKSTYVCSSTFRGGPRRARSIKKKKKKKFFQNETKTDPIGGGGAESSNTPHNINKTPHEEPEEQQEDHLDHFYILKNDDVLSEAELLNTLKELRQIIIKWPLMVNWTNFFEKNFFENNQHQKNFFF